MIWSLPSWERGLKLLYEAIDALIQQVAPLVGAWIEIFSGNSPRRLSAVAPLVGARIVRLVAPLVGAWIEI